VKAHGSGLDRLSLSLFRIADEGPNRNTTRLFPKVL
jgi:hypothetical protein